MTEQPPIRTPWRQRLDDFMGTPLTVVIWLAMAAGAGLLLWGRAGRVSFVGIAQPTIYEISPAITGTLARLQVRTYEPIDAGTAVAMLDSRDIEARLETARAVTVQLRAEWEKSRSELAAGTNAAEIDRHGELRRFAIDVERLRIEALTVRVAIESDRVVAERLRLQRDRVAELHRDGVASDAEFDEARLRYDRVVRRLDENQKLLERIDEERNQAVARQKNFELRSPTADSVAVSLAPLRAAIDVQIQRVAELEVAREALVLRCPVSGQVERVYARPGQAVVAGEPVLAVARSFASEVLAYAPEGRLDSVAAGSRARVVTADGRDGGISVVERIGPTIGLLPDRLWRNPAVREYGRPILIAVAQPQLVPGEIVRVEFPRGGN